MRIIAPLGCSSGCIEYHVGGWLMCPCTMVWKAAVHVEKINTPTFFCHVFRVSCLPESQCLVHKWKKWRLELRLSDKALTYLAFTKPCFGPWSHKFKKKKKRKKWVGLASSIPDTLFCIWIFSFVVFKISCSWHTCLIKDEKLRMSGVELDCGLSQPCSVNFCSKFCSGVFCFLCYH